MSTVTDYATFPVPTPEGDLTVGRWGTGERGIVAAHGVTGTHAQFHALADQLDDRFTLLAPDLRGRGGSNDVGGPLGMATHADDVARIMDHLSIDQATVLGHSMGGFVALVTADRHPDRVRDLVLVDGGLPPDLGPIADLPIEEAVRMIIGPSLDRLRMTFASLEDYFDFWRPHPALANDWSEYVERYLAYDLVGEAPQLRSGVREEAVIADSQSDLRGAEVDEAVLRIKQSVLFVRAPLGVFNQEPPLYTEEHVAGWAEKIPQLRTMTVPDVNHFTILLSERGAAAVAGMVSAEVS
jgi:pimeloyl-ACP methyl ester carboxylesterase